MNSVAFSFAAPLIDSLNTEKVTTTWTDVEDYSISNYKVNPYGVSRDYKGLLFYKFDYEGLYIDKTNGNVFQRKWLSHGGIADVGGYSYILELGNWDLSPTDTSKIIVGEYDSYSGGECRIRSYKNGKIDTLYSWINNGKNLHRNQRGSYYFYSISDSKFLIQYDATNVDGPNQYDVRISNYINIEKNVLTNIGTLYGLNKISLGSMEVNNEKNRIITSTVNKDPYNHQNIYPNTYNYFKLENDSLKNSSNINIVNGTWFKCFIDDTLSAYKNSDTLILYNYISNKIEGSYYLKGTSYVNGLYQDSVHGISTFVLSTTEGKKLMSIHLSSKKVVMNKVITAPYFGKYLTTLADGSKLSIGNSGYLYKHNLSILNFDTVTSNFNTNTIADNSIQFYDDSFGPIVEWNWDFGDGATSKLTNPIHKYSQPNTYQVTLRVKNDYGSEHSITKAVKVEQKLTPAFDFGTFSGSVPLKIDFSNYSTPIAVRYIWNFGDGKYSYEKNPSHTFTASGTYSVSLTVFDENGKFRTHISQKKVIAVD